MKKTLKKYFIAHKGNDHRPHIFRAGGILFSVYLILLLALASVVQTQLLDNPNFLSSILPSVLVELTNGDRKGADLNQLTINPVLEEAARLKAKDMAENGYFSHYSPTGVSPWYWFDQVDYDYAFAGENLAMDFHDSGAVENAWMESPTHKANILSQNFSEIGIAAYKGEIDGHSTIFVVQLFGHPRKATVATAQAEEPTPTPAPMPEPELSVPEKKESIVTKATPVINEPDVITETETFIAVKAADLADGLGLGVEGTKVAGSTTEAPYLRRVAQKLATSPLASLSLGYLIFALLLMVTITSIMVKEIKAHHLHQIASGAMLIFFMVSLLGLSYQWVFSEVVVR